MSKFDCEVCGCGPKDGIAVHRQAPKGSIGMWRCDFHNQKYVDPAVASILHAVQANNGTLPPINREGWDG